MSYSDLTLSRTSYYTHLRVFKAYIYVYLKHDLRISLSPDPYLSLLS